MSDERKAPKLNLSKETLGQLDVNDLDQVAGGVSEAVSGCYTCTCNTCLSCNCPTAVDCTPEETVQG